jgi:hypothetical protein
MLPSLVPDYGKKGGQLMYPDGINATPLTVDYESGGVALSDASAGFFVKTWVGFSEGLNIYIKPEDDSLPKYLLTTGTTDVTELSISFDQNMRPLVVYVDGGVTKLFWFDPSVSSNATTVFTNMNSPKLTLDDKNDYAIRYAESEILLWYMFGGDLKYRKQSDRYGVEYTYSAGVPGVAQRINKVGLDKSNRMHIEIQLRVDS